MVLPWGRHGAYLSPEGSVQGPRLHLRARAGPQACLSSTGPHPGTRSPSCESRKASRRRPHPRSRGLLSVLRTDRRQASSRTALVLAQP